MKSFVRVIHSSRLSEIFCLENFLGGFLINCFNYNASRCDVFDISTSFLLWTVFCFQWRKTSVFKQGLISSPSERSQMTINCKYSIMGQTRKTNTIPIVTYFLCSKHELSWIIETETSFIKYFLFHRSFLKTTVYYQSSLPVFLHVSQV